MWVPKVSAKPPLQGGSVPAWCGLPAPGQWALAITPPSDTRVQVVPIDLKRVYSVGGGPDVDIAVAELEGICVRIFHHRDGSVLLATGDTEGSQRAVVSIASTEGVVRELGGDLERLEENGEILIHSAVGIVRMQLRRRPSASVRTALSELQSEDATTRANTALNKKKRHDSPQHLTPQRRRKKGRVRFIGDSPALGRLNSN